MRKYFCLNILLPIAILLVQGVYGQEDPKVVVIDTPGGSNCEFVAATADSALQSLKSPAVMFVISYRGVGENRKDLELQRLRAAVRHAQGTLTTRADGLPAVRMVSAVADEKLKMGQLDYYADGTLFLRIRFRKNAYLAISPCHREVE